MTIITSKANNLIKNTKKLLQKKYRKTSYLIEGWHLFEEAKKAGVTFRHIFVVPEMAERIGDRSELVLVSIEVLRELTESKSPQGIVAEIMLESHSLPDQFSGKLLVLEDVQDPGNVGTMIRTADAAGFDGVLLSQKSADIYNDKTLRSMQGSHFHLPIWRGDLFELLASFKEAKKPIVATTLSQTSVDYKDLPHLENFALVMGNEGQGISKEMTAFADHLAHITMPGDAESLNVAVAAGIMMFSLI
ncbi:TrmH family RNA methyltransferase [Streptococcus saliviloxodontae]|uniref:TrmH family RNA methyltransferase n=1 Tax=Streptococcus saliviloxodontae TaxID=1349416 RepID=A0ABS2PJK4_9STRE|nr:RNA methyltransferase [Streptococcus saliviloxodontae]MBM7635610.1 TrmH family RNA methyltransferase [Streptococcus saliviloxodontae]